MATTAVTLNGVTYFVPQPGEQGPTYDQDLTNYLVALATAFPQGGASPSSTFQALISATANPASSGQIRLAKSDLFQWRNNANTNNLALSVGDGVSFPGDELLYTRGGVATTQVSGQTYASAFTSTATSIPAGAFTVINFGSVVSDTESTITTGASWHFTVPPLKGGVYLFTAQASLSGLAASATAFGGSFFVGGSQTADVFNLSTTSASGGSQSIGGATLLSLVAGNTVDFRVFQSNGAARNLTGAAANNYIVIKRLV